MFVRRMGRKKAPFYRIVVADSRSPRDGRCIEEIGTYDPNCNPSAYKVDEEKAKKWLATGAQPTEVVSKIFRTGIMRPLDLHPIDVQNQDCTVTFRQGEWYEKLKNRKEITDYIWYNHCIVPDNCCGVTA